MKSTMRVLEDFLGKIFLRNKKLLEVFQEEEKGEEGKVYEFFFCF
jgi:hypothetical protein